MSIRTYRLLAALMALGASQSGCSILSPVPTWELIKAVGGASGLAMASGGAKASNTVFHHHAPISAVCIEFNPNTPLADLLPALQIELKKHAVDSRIYESGTARSACPNWLRYTAYVDYDTRPFGSAPRLYLRVATLTLSRADGSVLSQSQYDADDGLVSGKWASTREKLSPVVTALITGF